MSIKYFLKGPNGEPVEGEIQNTIHEIDRKSIARKSILEILQERLYAAIISIGDRGIKPLLDLANQPHETTPPNFQHPSITPSYSAFR